eukprot:6615639-Prymnesium_polylepis.1
MQQPVAAAGDDAGDSTAARLVRDGVLRCQVRVRHQQRLGGCEVRFAGDGLHVAFDEPWPHVAEQQALVLYDGEVCLGGASICERLEPALAPIEGVQIGG